MTPRPANLHVDKPWGSFDQFLLNTSCTVKILTCNPGQRLSLQRHRRRDELWVALDPGVVVERDGLTLTPEPGGEVWLPAGSLHRMSCTPTSGVPVRVLEISLGTFDENDIERLEDQYGRTEPEAGKA
jgi:mannose-1-phosphate guanylyltransferase/mannose-6-phosphate isomerase